MTHATNNPCLFRPPLPSRSHILLHGTRPLPPSPSSSTKMGYFISFFSFYWFFNPSADLDPPSSYIPTCTGSSHRVRPDRAFGTGTPAFLNNTLSCVGNKIFTIIWPMIILFEFLLTISGFPVFFFLYFLLDVVFYFSFINFFNINL